MKSTVSNNKIGHPLERYVPAVDLGMCPVEVRLLLGSFHRTQKPLHTRRHIHTGGRGEFPRGMASLHVSSSSLAPLGPSSSPFRLQGRQAPLTPERGRGDEKSDFYLKALPLAQLIH